VLPSGRRWIITRGFLLFSTELVNAAHLCFKTIERLVAAILSTYAEEALADRRHGKNWYN
jgi:hypothetical protein